jgi:hypothetical protein
LSDVGSDQTAEITLYFNTAAIVIFLELLFEEPVLIPPSTCRKCLQNMYSTHT